MQPQLPSTKRFDYGHLPAHLHGVARPFNFLANEIHARYLNEGGDHLKPRRGMDIPQKMYAIA